MKIKSHLGLELTRSLKKNFFKLLLIDRSFSEPLRVKRGTMLVLAMELSRELKRKIPEKRVGVVLPPGLPGVLANLSLLMANKIPVNLNFTIGEKAVLHSLQKAEISTILTADAIKRKLPDFPWSSHLFDLGEWLKKKKRQKWQLLWKHFQFFFTPVSKLASQLSKSSCQQEAALLFTSGSSGNPKGVVLSHMNLLANCHQIQKVDLFESQTRVLANLPLFHSFGFTVCTLFPLLSDLVMVCVPSPLDVKSSLKAIEKEKVEVILGTPTFLRGYLRKASKEQMVSVRFVVAGAEKTPDGFKEEWESLCNCHYLEGYGLTESSPAISFNLPGTGSREKSVGRMLPEIQGKTVSPDSAEELPFGETGMLCFKGPNIFAGYLEDSKATHAAFDARGWYVTGDLGRLDEDGFLFIEGRLSRFSKIGGEMVPHAKLEEEIQKTLSSGDSQTQSFAVLGTTDSSKGEKLVILTTIEMNLQDLRKNLLANGIPNLWIPKEIKFIEEMPMLASGKLDLSKLQKLANEN